MKPALRSAIAVVVLSLAWTVHAAAEEKAPDTGPTTTPAEASRTRCGETAPDFTLEQVDGTTFTLSGQRGRVTLINFFATWCPPCIEELPHLQEEIAERFSPDHLRVICVGREEKNGDLPKFARKHDLDLPMAGDPTREVYARYAEHTIPRNVVVGPQGRILFQSIGFERGDFDRMIGVLEGALGPRDAR